MPVAVSSRYPPSPSGLWRVRHRARHAALALGTSATLRGLYRIFDPEGPQRPPTDQAAALVLRHRALMQRDLDNVELGLYPKALLDAFPLPDLMRALPRLLLEIPRAARRKRRDGWRELPDLADDGAYPSYYLRNFHWQSDGWFSDRSAELYDASVELLFAGTGNMMRRMSLPPLTRAFGREGTPRILDVGCGTGGYLKQIRTTLPQSKLTGLDLSPAYVEHARRQAPFADIVHANAEALPFEDGSFDAVTSVFMFHELPKAVRRTVANEMYRVTRPGGWVVLNDSAQIAGPKAGGVGDGAEISFFLDSFPERFHEPFYAHYLRDPLAGC